jgi:hypothetical protein
LRVDSDVIDQLLFKLFVFVRYGKKWEYNGAIILLVLDIKIAYKSVRRKYSHLVLNTH